MLSEDSHAERERNEAEDGIQLLEFLKNIQNYEEQMNDDSYKADGIKLTRLNILSFSWALQLTDHLAKEHAKGVAPSCVDLTTLYLSKDLTTINLIKEKSEEKSFLDNKYFEEEIKEFQEESEINRRDFNVAYNQEEVKDMCEFIYVFYLIALIFELHFTESKEFNPEEFINQLSLNHPPAHISPIIQRAIILYEEGELSTLKDVHDWLEKNRLECQFNLIELLKSSKHKNLRFYPIGKFTKKLDTLKLTSHYIECEVNCNDTTGLNSGALCLKEFTGLHHNNGRNIRICFDFAHEFVSKTKGFIVDNHRISGILFEELECNFVEIANRTMFTREILLQLAQVLSTILAKMHKMGIAYRDLKPDNIMVTKTNADGSFSAEDIRLIDFDNATYLGQKNTADVGTYWYSAPEVNNDRYDKRPRTLIEYNEKVDSYSLAMTLYYLMTKRLPYGNWESKKREFRYIDDSQTERGIRNYYEYVMSDDKNNKPPELEYDADSYDDIKEIINMGKHADPEKRWTMEEIKRAVEEKLQKPLV